MTLRIIRTAALMVAGLFLVGFQNCARMEDARRLSSELVTAQEKQNETRQLYYVAIDKLLDQQMLLAYMVIDDATEEQMQARNEKLGLDITAAGDDPIKKMAAIQSAAQDISAFASDSAVKKQKIADRVALIKAKHGEISSADEELLLAQKEIDRWVQLKKVDEVIAESTINRLRQGQARETGATKAATSTALDLLNTIKGGPQQ